MVARAKFSRKVSSGLGKTGLHDETLAELFPKLEPRLKGQIFAKINQSHSLFLYISLNDANLLSKGGLWATFKILVRVKVGSMRKIKRLYMWRY